MLDWQHQPQLISSILVLLGTLDRYYDCHYLLWQLESILGPEHLLHLVTRLIAFRLRIIEQWLANC